MQSGDECTAIQSYLKKTSIQKRATFWTKRMIMNSLSAVWTDISPAAGGWRPRGTGKWNNWCFLFFTKSEKPETTSSDCLCFSVLVFHLYCPQNSTERVAIGRIILFNNIFDSYSTDIPDIFIINPPSRMNYCTSPLSEGKINFKMNHSRLVS